MSRTVKYLFTALVISLLLLIISGCSSNIVWKLNRTPLDLLLISIKPNDESKVYYNFSSDIPEPFIFKSVMGSKYFIPVTSAFKDNINVYISTKFNNLIKDKNIEKPNVEINVTLVSFGLKTIYVTSTGVDYEGTPYFQSATIELLVVVSKDSKKIGEKNIIATTETVNKTIETSLIMFDKFLVSLGL